MISLMVNQINRTMATINEFDNNGEETPVTTTGEPTDQLAPDESDAIDKDIDADDTEFDETPIEDDDEDLDDDEVKRLFPSDDQYAEDDDDEEPYEGIRQGEQEDEGLVDDNMTGMPVIPSPS